MAILLRVESLTKRYGGLTAVNNVSFDVMAGEIVGIIGPNGAGKTTLFDLITGFQRPDEGRIKFRGRDITNKKVHEIANIGICRTFQLLRPFKKLTVLENVMVSLESDRARKVWARWHKGPVLSALELVQLVGLVKEKFTLAENLSHGDLKKLELARALAAEPELLLLDEILSGLSPIEVNELIKVIRRIAKEKELTIMMVEHKISELMKLVNRVIVLHYGQVLAEGEPEEIVSNEEVIEAYLGRRRTGIVRG